MTTESYLSDDGNAWERRVKIWLRLRYPGGLFEEVPAEHHGDYGVEGFSRDGIAYQCYAPKGRLRTKDLYENQRDKINKDINKFINNKDELLKLFGSVAISSWWLVVPEHKSSKLVQHATDKAAYVRSLGLPYVAKDFHIHIATAEDFAVERQAAIRKGVEALQLEETEVAEGEVQDWADKNDALVKVLDRKIRAYSGETRAAKIEELRDGWIESFIAAENTLKKMQRKYADVWEEFRALKKRKERVLFAKYSTHAAAHEVLAQTIGELRVEIENKVPNLSSEKVQELSLGTVAEWLHQCPLDFPNGSNEE
jgi:hypothetical protein